MTDQQLDTKTGWLSRDDLQNIRANVPLVYVDAVPVRVDELGRVTKVGMLLRQAADGRISGMVVRGRVRYGEGIGEALLRRVRTILADVASVHEEIEAMRGGPGGGVAVGAAPAALVGLMPAVIDALSRPRNAIKSRVVEGLGAPPVAELCADSN